jgi:hypothetical protein
MTVKQRDTLLTVAIMVGIDSNNPDGGLSHDSRDSDIVETIVDIANGSPHKLGIDPSILTADDEANVVRAFFDGAYDR